MRNKPWDCPKCGKCFNTKRGARDHIGMVHGPGIEPRKRPEIIKPDREESLADISVNASLKRLTGEPLDELEVSLINDEEDWQ